MALAGKKIHGADLVCLLLAGAFVLWSGLYIYNTSFIAIDGNRYFGLADDAMISMRYAWNFAHGQGLVWNTGQRVEGYSNLLMTLIMSLAASLLNKKFAVLAIQLLGIPTILTTAYVVKKIAAEIQEGGPSGVLLGPLAFACVLAYYPLNLWTLMGMETGLVTMFVFTGVWCALRWLKTHNSWYLTGLALTAGLANLARNDSVMLTGITFAYVALETLRRQDEKRRLPNILYAAVLFVLFPIGQTIFRYLYYGELLPNTYVLKLTNFPLYIRLIGGTRFVLEFLGQTWPLIALAALCLLLEFRTIRAFLFAFLLAALAYQIYVGGEPWNTWRMLSPAMPALFIVSISGATAIASRWSLLESRHNAAPALAGILVLVSLTMADLQFLSDITLNGPTSDAIANSTHTNAAIAIDALTRPEATVGVIWAGTLPYYSDRPAIDFLGKSDAYIAHLQADITGASGWGGMISVPGHNKYDLMYSIVQLQPTSIQAYSWGYQTVKPWVEQNYARVEYHGVAGTKTVWLLKDSPLVCWDACKGQYTINPWPGGSN